MNGQNEWAASLPLSQTLFLPLHFTLPTFHTPLSLSFLKEEAAQEVLVTLTHCEPFL